MKRFARVLLALVLLTLAGCAATPSSMNPRTEALDAYATAIRWSEFSDAWSFVDPALRQQQPLTELELARFKQIQVTGYEVKGRSNAPDGSIEQTAEIRLINKNTQIERTVTDHQRWRWDPAVKQFWLISGLPDFTAQ